ncbi:MAG: hypothetical protein KBT46_03400 [Ruminococcus sp.]|nr:hypothetical protein [Candidatus Copronaster equi]
MLGKLLKNEFIATGRIMGAVYAVVAILMAYILGSYYISKGDSTGAQALGIMVLILISSCNIFFTAVIMIFNFQKSLYSDQGYLSFTLPVKGQTLLASKVITSVVWFVAAIICFIGTAALTFYTIKEDVIGEETYGMMESLLPMFLNGKSIATIITALFIKILTYFISMAMITVELYFSISIANTRKFQKHHTIWTIVFILVITGIVSKISEVVSDKITFGLSVVDKGFELVTSISQFAAGSSYVDLVTPIVSIVFGAAFFYGTFYLMNKKVNIS